MAAKPTDLPIGLKARIIGGFGFALIGLFGKTLRFRLITCGPIAPQEQSNYVWAVWHNCLFSFPLFYRLYFSERKAAALTSVSEDGAIAADVVRRLGLAPIRGSNSRRGGAALLELASWLEEGYDVALTPDGPKGPRYHLSPGMIMLAKKTRKPVMPVSVHYHNCWKLKSWDRFRIPKPFSLVDVHVGPSLTIPPDTAKEEFEPYRVELEDIMCQFGCDDRTIDQG